MEDAKNFPTMIIPKGTEVTVTIIREDEPKPIDYKLVRDVIPIHSVKAIQLQPGYGYVSAQCPVP